MARKSVLTDHPFDGVAYHTECATSILGVMLKEFRVAVRRHVPRRARHGCPLDLARRGRSRLGTIKQGPIFTSPAKLILAFLQLKRCALNACSGVFRNVEKIQALPSRSFYPIQV